MNQSVIEVSRWSGCFPILSQLLEFCFISYDLYLHLALVRVNAGQCLFSIAMLWSLTLSPEFEYLGSKSGCAFIQYNCKTFGSNVL